MDPIIQVLAMGIGYLVLMEILKKLGLIDPEIIANLLKNEDLPEHEKILIRLIKKVQIAFVGTFISALLSGLFLIIVWFDSNLTSPHSGYLSAIFVVLIVFTSMLAIGLQGIMQLLTTYIKRRYS